MPDNKYWEKRFEILEDSMNNKGEKHMKDAEDMYLKAIKETEKEISRWYMRFAKNEGISYNRAVEMLSNKELKEFHMDVKEYIEKGETLGISDMWKGELERASVNTHITRLQALKMQMQQQVEELTAKKSKGINKLMSDIYSDTFYKSAFEIQKGLGVGSAFDKLDKKSIDKILSKPWAADGSNFSERIWGSHRAQLVNKLHEGLTLNLIQGKPSDDLIKDIASTFNVDKKRAATLVYTEKAYFQSIAQRDSFKELGVEEYEIVATLDSLTSEICQIMDGEHFKLDDFQIGSNAPPFHPRCRTAIAPFFDDEFEDEAKRAARDEEGKYYTVPANMKYDDWYKAFIDGDESVLVKFKPIKAALNVVGGIEKVKSIKEVEQMLIDSGWFKDLSSDDELLEFFDRTGQRQIMLNDMDLESAKSVYRTSEKFFNKYPQMKGRVTELKTDKLNGGTLADTFFMINGSGESTLTLNKKVYSDYKAFSDLCLKNVKNGWLPKGTNADSVLMHEYGHTLDFYLTNGIKVFGVDKKGNNISASKELKKRVLKSLKLNKYDIEKELSAYATKNDVEWFAEAFCEYMDSDNPRPMAKELGKQLDEIMKDIDNKSLSNKRIDGFAESMIAKAKEVEPQITDNLKEIVKNSGGKLEGLDFRLKGESSLKRKLKSEMLETGLNIDDVSSKMYDLVRYTSVAETDKISQHYLNVIEDMKRKGYNVVRVKNTLGNENAMYRGINCVIETKDGYKFELQFHTPESLENKEINHKLYEEYRLDDTSGSRKKELQKQMIDNLKKLKKPVDIDKIKSFDNLKKG